MSSITRMADSSIALSFRLIFRSSGSKCSSGRGSRVEFDGHSVRPRMTRRWRLGSLTNQYSTSLVLTVE